VHYGLQVGGRWPDPREVAVDGSSIRTDLCYFILPWPPDPRLGSALLIAPVEEELAPGTVAIWLEQGSVHVELDGSTLDPERLEQLRDLGYVR